MRSFAPLLVSRLRASRTSAAESDRTDARSTIGETASIEQNTAEGQPDHATDRGYDSIWGPGCSNDDIDAGDYTELRFFQLDLEYYNETTHAQPSMRRKFRRAKDDFHPRRSLGA